MATLIRPNSPHQQVPLAQDHDRIPPLAGWPWEQAMINSRQNNFDSSARSLKTSRREWMCVGGLSWLGLSESMLSGLRRSAVVNAADVVKSSAPAKRCVFIFLFGGPSHVDLWDLKPLAPENVRGIYRPIATSAHFNIVYAFVGDHDI